jgi:type IV pilus assembly protein PilB
MFQIMITLENKFDAETLLLNPDLFSDFAVIKYGIPVFNLDSNVYVLSKNQGVSYKFQDKNLINIETDLEDFVEKVFLINNYETWKNQKYFCDKSPIRSILDFILIQGIVSNSSDIHINPFDDHYEVMFRIDTLLEKAFTLTKKQGEYLLMRLKVISFLDTSETKLPQSSSFRRFFKNQYVDFRFSTHPTFLKERCVIRILQNNKIPDLEELGFSDEVFEVVRKVIESPSGLIVFSGPTNSGKTTSIHAILRQMLNKGLNIMTLEDPIEYRIPGIIQTNIRENGMDFFQGMKSILRQDPNVIFLGEIRDENTAKLAAQAAMTGHKVLTTLHTSSNKGIINRLYDLGVSLRTLSQCLVALFSQRLVRKFNKETGEYESLALVADALALDKQMIRDLENGLVPEIEDNLRNIGLNLVEKGISTSQEVKRVIG